MKSLIFFTLLFSFTAFANVVPDERLDYKMSCDTGTEESLSITYDGGKTVTLEWTQNKIPRTEVVEQQNQTKLQRVSSNDDGSGKVYYYVKTLFENNSIQLEWFTRHALGWLQFEQKITITFTKSDMSEGYLSDEYFFGDNNITEYCKFSRI